VASVACVEPKCAYHGFAIAANKKLWVTGHSLGGALANGETLDKSVRSGREKLKAKGESEWANYMPYGYGRFQLIAG
jgi:hypothetical protein